MDVKIIETLKVAANSKPPLVAGAVANIARKNNRAYLNAIGADAVNQAVKAVAIARGYVTSNGIDLICVPSFFETIVDGVKKTAIRLSVEAR